MMATVTTESYAFDPRPNYPLFVTAKRYWKPSSPHVNDPEALTLIFTHGTGFHKEHWEPTIDDLYSLIGDDRPDFPKVREMWSIDAPNHGDAGILNEKTLQLDYQSVFRWEEYGRSVHALLAGLGTGIGVDFTTRRLVGIGHSMGAVALVDALRYQPMIKFESLILVELMCMSPNFYEKAKDALVKGSENRRDIWVSRDEAYRTLKSRPAWKVWDDRVLRLYVNAGLRALPTINYPDKTGVTLKCCKIQETASYKDGLTLGRVYLSLARVAQQVPTHMIYGTIDDYLPRKVKEDVVQNAAGGVQNLASFTEIEGVGHLVVQINPQGLARSLHKALTHPRAALQSRL